MGFELCQNEKIGDGLRRIAHEQVERAMRSIAQHADSASTVWEVRKHLKKTRAVMRCALAALDEDAFQKANHQLRDVAAKLSRTRDSAVWLERLGELSGNVSRRCTRTRALLKAEEEHANADALKSLREAARSLKEIESDLEALPWPELDWDGWMNGVRSVYKRGRRAFRDASRTGSTECLHEWRKRSKDLMYLLRLIESAERGALGELARQVKTLSELTGEDHDFAMLCEKLAAREEIGDERDLLLPLIRERRAELQQAALFLGERFYAPKPREFSKSIDCLARKFFEAPCSE